MSVQQGQPVSNLIKVQVLLGSAPAQGENVDTMLILGSTPDVIDTTQRMRNYTALSQVAADFGTAAPEYLATQVWFAQLPQPLSVNIGFWAKNATNGILIGGPLSAAQKLMATWQAVTQGQFTLYLDSIPYTIATTSLAAQSNLNGVAAALQAALITAGAPNGTTIVWDSVNSVFRVYDGGNTAGVTSTVSFMQLGRNLGTISFSGQPANNDTVSINNTTITFVTGAPSGNQVQIAGSLAATITALVAFINTHFFLSTATSAASTVYLVSSAAANVTINLAKSGTNIAISGATLTGASFGATDLSGMMDTQSTSSGAYTVAGIAAETALSAVALLDDMYSNQWYGLAVLGGVNADYVAVAGYVEAANIKHYLTTTDQEGACLVSTDTTSLMYQLNALGYNKTACQYSSTSPYAGISYLARILTTNWTGNNTTITLQYKTEPGIAGETLSTTQLNNILAKKGSVYIKYNNGTTIIQGAFSCSGQYTDTIIGVDWFAIQLMTDLYNALYTTPTKIPQTDAGMTDLHAVIEADCAAAANNGLFAPGTWTLPGFGAIVNGQYLPKGYYIYQPPVALQNSADRQARKSVNFQIAGKLGGAVHEADVAVTINQ